MLRHLLGNLFLSFLRRRPKVRGDNHVLHPEEDAFGRGLSGEYVQCGATDVTVVNGLLQVRFNHQSAARAVDNFDTLLGLGERVRVDDIARRIGHRSMQGNDIGTGQKVIQFQLLNTQFLRTVWRKIRVIADNLHLQSLSTIGNNGADITAPNYTQGLAGHFHAHEAGFFPFTQVGRGVGERDIPRQ